MSASDPTQIPMSFQKRLAEPSAEPLGLSSSVAVASAAPVAEAFAGVAPYVYLGAMTAGFKARRGRGEAPTRELSCLVARLCAYARAA